MRVAHPLPWQHIRGSARLLQKHEMLKMPSARYATPDASARSDAAIPLHRVFWEPEDLPLGATPSDTSLYTAGRGNRWNLDTRWEPVRVSPSRNLLQRSGPTPPSMDSCRSLSPLSSVCRFLPRCSDRNLLSHKVHFPFQGLPAETNHCVRHERQFPPVIERASLRGIHVGYVLGFFSPDGATLIWERALLPTNQHPSVLSAYHRHRSRKE